VSNIELDIKGEKYMKTLSEKEVEEVVNNILPAIRIATDKNGEAGIYMRDLADINPAVKGAGITSDVYYKVAVAMFDHGICTDIVANLKGESILSFRNIREGENAPTITLCKLQWEKANISVEIDK
jgi:hypothetical protein